MKRILVIMTVVVAIATSVSAGSSSKYTVFSRMNNTSTINGIAHYLEVDLDQKAQLISVLTMTDAKMKLALNENSEIEANKALNFNLGNMKHMLSEEQYKKYLNVLNVTVSNDEETFIAEL